MEPIIKIYEECPRLFIFGKVAQKQSPDVFLKKSVLKNFAKFAEKYLCQSLFFTKVVGWRPVTLLKQRLWQVFSVNFAKLIGTPPLRNICERMAVITKLRRN